MRNPESIYCNSRRVAAALITVDSVGNPPTSSLLSGTALEEVNAPISTAEGEDSLHSFSHKPVANERPAATTWHTQFCSSARV